MPQDRTSHILAEKYELVQEIFWNKPARPATPPSSVITDRGYTQFSREDLNTLKKYGFVPGDPSNPQGYYQLVLNGVSVATINPPFYNTFQNPNGKDLTYTGHSGRSLNPGSNRMHVGQYTDKLETVIQQIMQDLPQANSATR
jgi:hypothetical protein